MFPGHMMIIIVNTFIQDIYKYVPKKKKRVFRVYNVATVLWLQYVLFPMINIVHFSLVLPAVCVQCPVWQISVVL